MITIVKVVSRNVVDDLLAYFQNLFGKNLSGYEKMVNEGITQCEDELKHKKIKLGWFRFEVTQLTNGAAMVMLYGEEI